MYSSEDVIEEFYDAIADGDSKNYVESTFLSQMYSMYVKHCKLDSDRVLL